MKFVTDEIRFVEMLVILAWTVCSSFLNKVHLYPDLSTNQQTVYQKDWSMIYLHKGWKLATVYLLIIITKKLGAWQFFISFSQFMELVNEILFVNKTFEPFFIDSEPIFIDFEPK